MLVVAGTDEMPGAAHPRRERRVARRRRQGLHRDRRAVCMASVAQAVPEARVIAAFRRAVESLCDGFDAAVLGPGMEESASLSAPLARSLRSRRSRWSLDAARTARALGRDARTRRAAVHRHAARRRDGGLARP